MTPVIKIEEINSPEYKKFIPFKCEICHSTYLATRHTYLSAMNPNKSHKNNFCSRKCLGLSKTKTGSITTSCKNCNKKITKRKSQAKRTQNHFCSRSCAGTYNNLHKKHGTRRSKLEAYVESQLPKLFPSLQINYNKKDAINSELDIYIPSLKLAFELNGVFHYKPIFGKEKLDFINDNDSRKFQACLEKEIELCIIDASQQKYFTQTSSEKYLNTIKNIIENRMGTYPIPTHDISISN